MSEENNEANNKSIKIIIISAVIIITAGLGFYLFRQEGQKIFNLPAADSDISEAEAEMIRELNKEAIRAAQNIADSDVRPISVADHLLGDPAAPVQLIAYLDYECPFSAVYYSTIEEIKKNYGEQIVVAFRHFPLATHPSAVTAALAAECAAEQGKFWEMSEALFAANRENIFFPEHFKESAAGLDLDMVKFDQCLDTEKYHSKVEAQMIEARNYGVLGTPANFINAIPYAGALPLDDFTDSTGREREGLKTIIEKELGNL